MTTVTFYRRNSTFIKLKVAFIRHCCQPRRWQEVGDITLPHIFGQHQQRTILISSLHHLCLLKCVCGHRLLQQTWQVSQSWLQQHRNNDHNHDGGARRKLSLGRLLPLCFTPPPGYSSKTSEDEKLFCVEGLRPCYLLRWKVNSALRSRPHWVKLAE